MPDAANDLTIGEIMTYYRAYQIRQSKEWERTRELMFMIYKALGGSESKQIYDFMPLQTDPSEEERVKMKKMEEEKLEEEADKAFAFYRNLGYLN